MKVRSSSYAADKKAWLPRVNIIGFGMLVTIGILALFFFSAGAIYRSLLIDGRMSWPAAPFFAVGAVLALKVLPACYRQANAELKGTFSLEADESELRIYGLSGGMRAIPWDDIESVGIAGYYIGCSAVVIHHRRELAFGLVLPAQSRTEICEWIASANPKRGDPTAGANAGK